VSANEIPGLDLQERRPGTFRIRVRVHPFFALSAIATTELEAVQWGCRELQRLRFLRDRLHAEGRLPNVQLTSEAAEANGHVIRERIGLYVTASIPA